jgi:hypothetical protein
VTRETVFTLEHSVEVPVDIAFAWRFRTDVATWNDPPATFALDGPFADGATGTTLMPGQPPLIWRVRDVRPPHSFTIEMEFEGAVCAAEWRFDTLSGGRTKMTQRLSLFGPNASQYREQFETGFESNLADGMNRVAAAIVAACKT